MSKYRDDEIDVDDLKNRRGTRVYIPMRAKIDWGSVKEARKNGVSAARLARELGVSERTVTRHAPRDGND